MIDHCEEIETSSTPLPNDQDSEEEINKAYEESLKGDSILPILKHELRLKIQTRRLSQGQEELKSEKSPPKVYELTEEEKEKYQRRLQQNRESLRRSRIKDIKYEEQLKRSYDNECSKTEMLKQQREDLMLEKERLMDQLHQNGLHFNDDTSTYICDKCNMTFLFTVERTELNQN